MKYALLIYQDEKSWASAPAERAFREHRGRLLAALVTELRSFDLARTRCRTVRTVSRR